MGYLVLLKVIRCCPFMGFQVTRKKSVFASYAIIEIQKSVYEAFICFIYNKINMLVQNNIIILGYSNKSEPRSPPEAWPDSPTESLPMKPARSPNLQLEIDLFIAQHVLEIDRFIAPRSPHDQRGGAGIVGRGNLARCFCRADTSACVVSVFCPQLIQFFIMNDLVFLFWKLFCPQLIQFFIMNDLVLLFLFNSFFTI